MVIVGLLAALTTVAGLPSSAGAITLQQIHPTLHFVGDSITAQSATDLTSYFSRAGYAVTINAVPGSDTAADAHFVTRDAGLSPSVEVINLGTNDTRLVAEGEPLADVLHRLNTFASEPMFPLTCVVFTTVTTHATDWPPSVAAAINAWERTHFAHVADWDAAYNPAYYDGTGDNPHPVELGRHALTHVIADAIAGCSNHG
jgi:hypothetical protein